MGKQWKQWQTFGGGSKITADGDCSHEIKRCLLLGRKAMTSLNSILKSRDLTLLTKVHSVKAVVFPVVMCGCESYHKEDWALKNWCFWFVVLEKTLESPLDLKKSNQAILKENNLSSRWKDWCWSFNTLATWLEKILMLGKIESRRTRRQQRMRLSSGRHHPDWRLSLTQWTWVWVNSSRWWRTGKPGMLQLMGLQREITVTEQ